MTNVFHVRLENISITTIVVLLDSIISTVLMIKIFPTAKIDLLTITVVNLDLTNMNAKNAMMDMYWPNWRMNTMNALRLPKKTIVNPFL